MDAHRCIIRRSNTIGAKHAGDNESKEAVRDTSRYRSLLKETKNSGMRAHQILRHSAELRQILS